MSAAVIEPEAEIHCPTVAQIRAEVARYYSLTELDLLSARKSREVARPRQVAMFLCRHLTRHSLPSIGRLFGGRDHTTIIHGIRVIEELLFDDTILAADIGYIKARLA